MPGSELIALCWKVQILTLCSIRLPIMRAYGQPNYALVNPTKIVDGLRRACL